MLCRLRRHWIALVPAGPPMCHVDCSLLLLHCQDQQDQQPQQHGKRQRCNGLGREKPAFLATQCVQQPITAVSGRGRRTAWDGHSLQNEAMTDVIPGVALGSNAKEAQFQGSGNTAGTSVTKSSDVPDSRCRKGMRTPVPEKMDRPGARAATAQLEAAGKGRNWPCPVTEASSATFGVAGGGGGRERTREGTPCSWQRDGASQSSRK